jgi:hypothetical protein
MVLTHCHHALHGSLQHGPSQQRSNRRQAKNFFRRRHFELSDSSAAPMLQRAARLLASAVPGWEHTQSTQFILFDRGAAAHSRRSILRHYIRARIRAARC